MRILNYMTQAAMSNENGVARLHALNAIQLLRELSIDLNNWLLNLESDAQQPEEIMRD